MPDPKRNFEAFAASLNEAGFKVTPQSAPWSPDYLGRSTRARPATYLIGWTGDFADPDNFVGTFFQSAEQWGFQQPGAVHACSTRPRRSPTRAARSALYKEANR